MMQHAHPSKRWLIAAMGTLLQLCLGTVYAWSYFQQRLVDYYQWSHSQVAWVFSLAICFLGIAAAVGGVQLPKYGPRRLAVLGGMLFGGGYLLAAAALHLRSLWLLYLGYGVIGGAGLGLGYVTPVATVAKWFPDKKGLATGMVIMGFGFGAMAMSKLLAPTLFQWAHGDPVPVFAGLGVAFIALTVPTACCLINPPPPSAAPGGAAPSAANAEPAVPVAQHVLSWQFISMWIVFFCNILAGISIISFQSPLFQDLWRSLDGGLSTETLAAYGATLIAVSSLFNGVGRMFWGGLSDRIGRLAAFRAMLGTQLIAFGLLVVVRDPWLFAALICYVLLCYGGGFGTMPSFVLDVFGPKRMAVMYGTILTAWSAAGVVGPQIVAYLKERFALQAAPYSFSLSAAVLLVGLVLTLLKQRTSAV